MKQELAQLFKALSDANRLTILERLVKGETCACTLMDGIEITQPTMSYHLKMLSDLNLTTTKKDGTWKKHYVDFDKIDDMISYLEALKTMKGSCNL
ncbi:MAG: transcriptional regulator [Tenericutes bacterium HGW-Tenericutes-6]|nr:MAG: transcriptional regulator [Tenericutes bacterium HGW-Tenericutes-6]